uniref:Transcriptional regulator n=1 Tax=Heligmosomoides polygyrus TaxID=6339 RepID=A0A183FHL2_HELPZ
LDRQQGATEGLAKADINFYSSLTMDLILDGMISKNEITVERKHEIIEHLKKPFKKA